MLFTSVRQSSSAVLAIALRRVGNVRCEGRHRQQLVGQMCNYFKPAFRKAMEDGSGGISLSKTIRTLISRIQKKKLKRKNYTDTLDIDGCVYYESSR